MFGLITQLQLMPTINGLLGEITSGFMENMLSIGVFIDLWKGFHMVNHKNVNRKIGFL